MNNILKISINTKCPGDDLWFLFHQTIQSRIVEHSILRFNILVFEVKLNFLFFLGFSVLCNFGKTSLQDLIKTFLIVFIKLVLLSVVVFIMF